MKRADDPEGAGGAEDRDDADPPQSESLADRLDYIRDALDAGNSDPLRRFLEASRDRALAGLGRLPFADYTPPIAEGTRIGDFVVRERIDEGGMGVVYRGHQESVQRDVAIKVMRGQFTTGSYAVRQFSTEVEALTRLRHPGIVQVLASGAFEDGRPWLAMEFVEGLRLDRWMLVERSLNERLSLVCRLCDALEHAHERGVVHRDLKPSNVLVDDRGQPRVLDFGLARMLDRVTQDSLSGGPNRFAGTLPWMSPEQVIGRTADERSDVHSLGLILYRMVTGEPAYDIDSLHWSDAIEVLTKTSPRPHPKLYGDLEIVTRKALRRNPDRRFQRVQELRDELERVMRRQPVHSRPPTWSEQARDLVRRHPGVSVGLAVAFVSITSALIVSLIMYARLEQEQRNKQFRADILEQAMKVYDPERPDADRTPTRSLESALHVVEAMTSERNGIAESEILDSGAFIANLLVDLGNPAAAIPTLERVVRYVDANHSPPLVVAKAYRDLGFAYHANEQFQLAEKYKVAAFELRRANLPESHESVIQSRDEIADLLRDTLRVYPARKLLEENVEALRGIDDRVRLVRSLRALAATLAETGELSLRYDTLMEAEALLESLPRADLDTRAAVRCDLAFVAIDVVSVERAFDLLQEARRWVEQSGRASSKIAVKVATCYAQLLSKAGMYDLAVIAAKQAVELSVRNLGEAHDATRVARADLARDYSLLGHTDEAIEVLAYSRDVVERLRGKYNTLWRATTRDLASEIMTLGRVDEALQVAEGLNRDPNDESAAGLAIEFGYRTLRIEVFRYCRREDAVALELQRMLTLAQKLEPIPGTRVMMTLRVIGEQALRLGDHERVLVMMRQLDEVATQLAGIDCLPAAGARGVMACSLYALDRPAEAAELARSALDVLERMRGPNHFDTVNLRELIAMYRRG